MTRYIVEAKDVDGKHMFSRVLFARDRNAAIGLAVYDENKTLSRKRKLQRSKLKFSVNKM